LGRSPSTLSRELRRNAQPAGYANTSARSCAQQRRWQSRSRGKLHRAGILFSLMRHFLGELWSPEQLALTLAAIFPKGHEHRVSHETICTCIHAQPVGELKRELIATLRHAHNKRVPRSKGEDLVPSSR
jgi:IS30 family transposase